MKYELEPDNRNCSDKVLLDDLRAVAAKLGKDNLTQHIYKTHGRFGAATIKRRFGMWNTALEKCGLEVRKRRDIPTSEFVHDLRRVAELLRSRSVSLNAYDVHRSFSHDAVTKRFGSWANAVE